MQEEGRFTASGLTCVKLVSQNPEPLFEVKVNFFLLSTGSESLLIDAGWDVPAARQSVEEACSRWKLPLPTQVLVTHKHVDHAGGIRQFADWPLQVFCHSLDREGVERFLSSKATLHLLEEGSKLFLGEHPIHTMFTPGHTAGHLSFYLPHDALLFAGDNVLGRGTTWIGPPDGNMSHYMRSLQQLKQLSPRQLAPGHGEWVDHPAHRIAEIVQRREEREQEILQLLAAKPDEAQDANAITLLIYGDRTPDTILDLAHRTVIAHLEKLKSEGKVEWSDSGYHLSTA